MKAGSKSRWLIGPAIVVIAGVGPATAPAAPMRVEAAAAKVLTEDSRGIVAAKVGVPIEIRLRSQPGTGFSWVPLRSGNTVTEMKPAKSSRARPGSWQTQRFSFVAKRPGTYRLTFSYDQPWQGGTKGARTTQFMILVR